MPQGCGPVSDAGHRGKMAARATVPVRGYTDADGPPSLQNYI